MMTRFPISLLSLLVIGGLLLFGWSGLSAQRPAVEQPKMSIDAILLDDQSPPSLFFRDERGEYRPFTITQGARGSWNRVPKSRELVLYREGMDEAGNSAMLSAITLAMPNVERVLLFFFRERDGRLRHLALDDSAGVHRGGTGRLVNLTGVQVVCQVNREVIEIGPGQSVVTGPLVQDSQRFAFGFALREAEGYRVASNLGSFRLLSPQMRFMAAMTFVNEQVLNEHNEVEIVRIPQATRLYDREVPEDSIP